MPSGSYTMIHVGGGTAGATRGECKRTNGFAEMSVAEFGETLPLPPQTEDTR
jgi:hypothetical protein